MDDDEFVRRTAAGVRGPSRRRLLGGLAALFGAGVTRSALMAARSLDGIIDVPTADFDPKTAPRFVWAQPYAVPWTTDPRSQVYQTLSGHPAVIGKYKAVREQLLWTDQFSEGDFTTVLSIPPDALATVHSARYLEEVRRRAADFTWFAGIRSDGEFSETPIIPGTVQLQGSFVNGTYTAGRIALEQGVAMNLGGGLHHAKPGTEEGFCIFNDVAVAIRLLQREGYIGTAMIIDGDVHHGNGNARIFYKDDSVSIVDIFQIDNHYPGPDGIVPVECAIGLHGLRDYIDDDRYLLQMPIVLSEVARVQPDIVFYLSGADPYKRDMLGDFRLTKEGLQERDSQIVGGIKEMGIPVAVTLAGGYAPIAQEVINIHCNTAKVVKGYS